VPPHERTSASTAPAAAPAAGDRVPTSSGPDATPHRPPGSHERHERPDLVDWHRTGRRLRRQAVFILILVVVTWLVLGLRAGGPTVRTFAELFGVGVLLAIASEIVIVGGAALKGLLVAGDRGDRLAGADVSLLPPQVSRRLRQRRR
jgi:hypothetical protein